MNFVFLLRLAQKLPISECSSRKIRAYCSKYWEAMKIKIAEMYTVERDSKEIVMEERFMYCDPEGRAVASLFNRHRVIEILRACAVNGKNGHSAQILAVVEIILLYASLGDLTRLFEDFLRKFGLYAVEGYDSLRA